MKENEFIFALKGKTIYNNYCNLFFFNKKTKNIPNKYIESLNKNIPN